MSSTLAILLSAFILSVVALLAFIWTQRSGLFDASSKGARVIFAAGEMGSVEDPATSPRARAAMQAALTRASGEPAPAPLADQDLVARARAEK